MRHWDLLAARDMGEAAGPAASRSGMWFQEAKAGRSRGVTASKSAGPRGKKKFLW